MKRLLMLAIGCCLFASQPVAAQTQPADNEESTVKSNSTAFNASFGKSVDELVSSGFADKLESQSLGAMSNDSFQALVALIKAEKPLPMVSVGEPTVVYDVILQPGHYGRTTGRVGTAGKLVSERALAAYIAGEVAASLRKDGLKVLVVSADSYLKDNPQTPAWEGLSTKAFLAIHADGSEKPCSTGPSLAYQSTNSLMPMHAIGYGLASALGYSYDTFRKDNFTVNEQDYYMFRRVHAPALKGLLEVGELTCVASERKLLEAAGPLTDNLALALSYVVKAQR